MRLVALIFFTWLAVVALSTYLARTSPFEFPAGYPVPMEGKR